MVLGRVRRGSNAKSILCIRVEGEGYLVTIGDELLYACNNPVSFLDLDCLSRLQDTEVACTDRLLLERYRGKHLG